MRFPCEAMTVEKPTAKVIALSYIRDQGKVECWLRTYAIKLQEHQICLTSTSIRIQDSTASVPITHWLASSALSQADHVRARVLRIRVHKADHLETSYYIFYWCVSSRAPVSRGPCAVYGHRYPGLSSGQQAQEPAFLLAHRRTVRGAEHITRGPRRKGPREEKEGNHGILLFFDHPIRKYSAARTRHATRALTLSRRTVSGRLMTAVGMSVTMRYIQSRFTVHFSI
ncbi:hypothetical protein DFH11DRAFT_1624887 [Phellopilus nigrolimitatus]|nr:hypothetical protein DFH11DRAFT_1624887 [Phellopilus nigrolimitatus]